MTLKMKELPTSERPYEKLEIYGVNKLSNAELLAIIIKTGTKEESALTLAQKVLKLNKNNNINDVRFLQNTTIEELSKIKGIGKVKAMQIIAACEIAKRISTPINIENIKIKNSQDAANLLMNELKYEKREISKMILLNTKNIVQKIIDISYGGTNFTMINPKEIFHEAIKMNISKIIIALNHPSGDPTPSLEDLETTQKLISLGKMLGIEIIDHIIIAEEGCESIMRYINNKR